MKLIIFLFLLSLSLSLSKKKKKHHSESSESESNSDESLALSTSDDSEEGKKKHKNKKSHTHQTYFNSKGILRKNFAIELSFQHSGENVVCSPVSALLPLGKLVLGAEGKSRKELTEVIGVHKKSELSKTFKALIKNLQFVPGVKLDVASRIYVSEEAKLLSHFADSAKNIFSSGIEQISFKQPKQAADEINGWVSRQTNGMIPLLLEPEHIDSDTSLIIVNAVYFKGYWKYPFKETNIGDFSSPSGPKKVQLMTHQDIYRYTRSDVLNAEIPHDKWSLRENITYLRNISYRYADAREGPRDILSLYKKLYGYYLYITIVEIPYEGDEAMFVIVLPLEKAGLPLLLNQLKLAPNLLNSALKDLRKRSINLTIPKFSITTGFDLKEMYEKIGLKEMMLPKSGLKKIVKNEELRISSAIQKAVIEVHERGTEAAAASAIISASGFSKPIQFTADHPFLFYVQANKEQLFVGIFNEP